MTVLPFRQNKGDAMKTDSKAERNEDLKPRSIHLPIWLWSALDKDAKRCKRSSTKHLEALLTLCYDPEADLEIHKETLTEAYHAISQKRTKAA
jgi:hypothetical protein